MKTSFPLFAGALLGSLILAACGPQSEKADKVQVAPATEATMPADASGAVPAWSASNDGIGPINGGTAFDAATVTALLPGSEIKTAYLHEEGGETPIITAYGPQELSLELQGAKGKVSRILAQGGPVVGPKGEKIMDSFKVSGFAATDCVLGADRMSGAALCRRADAPNLALVYGAPGELKGNPGDAPDAAALAEKGFLREFLWQAPLAN